MAPVAGVCREVNVFGICLDDALQVDGALPLPSTLQSESFESATINQSLGMSWWDLPIAHDMLDTLTQFDPSVVNDPRFQQAKEALHDAVRHLSGDAAAQKKVDDEASKTEASLNPPALKPSALEKGKRATERAKDLVAELKEDYPIINQRSAKPTASSATLGELQLLFPSMASQHAAPWSSTHTAFASLNEASPAASTHLSGIKAASAVTTGIAAGVAAGKSGAPWLGRLLAPVSRLAPSLGHLGMLLKALEIADTPPPSKPMEIPKI